MGAMNNSVIARIEVLAAALCALAEPRPPAMAATMA
jgi:hypothetical protein